MTQKANFFKVGIFILMAFGLGAAFLIIFGAGQFFKKELLVETCFNESVQGLSIGSEIKYKGIKIGSVKSITSAARIYQTKSDYVLVIISLEEETSLGQTGKTTKLRVQKAIKDGLNVRLASKGLTGVAYLESDYSTNHHAETLDISWSPRNIYLPSQKSNIKHYGDVLSQILENLSAINIKGMTQDMEVLLKTLNQKLNSLDIKNISNLTASLLKELKATNRKVNSVIGSEKVKHFLDDAQTSFSELRTIIEKARDPLNNAIIDFEKAAGSSKNIASDLEANLAPGIENLSADVERLMKSLAATSDLLENMVWLNSDKIKLIIENLETTSENLKQMSRDIKRYPGRLLFEKPPEKQIPEE